MNTSPPLFAQSYVEKKYNSSKGQTSFGPLTCCELTNTLNEPTNTLDGVVVATALLDNASANINKLLANPEPMPLSMKQGLKLKTAKRGPSRRLMPLLIPIFNFLIISSH